MNRNWCETYATEAKEDEGEEDEQEDWEADVVNDFNVETADASPSSFSSSIA